MDKVYFDYAATTPLDPRVFKEMKPFLREDFGNSVSLHSFGQKVRQFLEDSRQSIADLLSCKPNEVLFTGSATESNNWALKGLSFASEKKHIIVSSIEHPCILETSRWLESRGFKVTKAPVDKQGLVDLDFLKKEITKDTLLVSIIHASNEIGTIQPIEKIGKMCREKGVYFHTDAAQSFGKIPVDLENVDLMTASSHKIYGPKGAALLFVKEGVDIEPLLHGGGQERGLRSSTVNVPAIVGFARASEIAFSEMAKEKERLSKLRDRMIKEVLKIDNCYLNGHPQKRLPNNANFRFSFIEGESLVLKLDSKGIATSTGSACSSEKLEPSHVLLAIGLKPEQAHGSLRVTLGRQTTEKEIDYFLKVLPEIVKDLRKISPFHG